MQYRRQKKRWFDPWLGKVPWRRKWQPTPVSLSGKFHGQRSLADCSLWGRKESRATERTRHFSWCVYVFEVAEEVQDNLIWSLLFSCLVLTFRKKWRNFRSSCVISHQVLKSSNQDTNWGYGKYELHLNHNLECWLFYMWSSITWQVLSLSFLEYKCFLLFLCSHWHSILTCFCLRNKNEAEELLVLRLSTNL